MDNIESVIWETITRSAKTKFDSESFANYFKEEKLKYVDNILYLVISGFANKQVKESVVNTVYSKMMAVGCNCSKADVESFITNKNELLKEEIYTAHVVAEMFKEHKEPAVVLNTVYKMLN